MNRRSLAIVCFVVCSLVLAAGRPATADVVRTVSYPIDRVWPAALRLLRVDLKLQIVERDREAGFILFDFIDDGRTWRGSVQLLPMTDPKGREGTRIAIKIEGRPSYLEDAMLGRLETKLREELGEPAPPPPKPTPPPPADKPSEGKPGDKPGEGKPPAGKPPATR